MGVGEQQRKSRDDFEVGLLFEDEARRLRVPLHELQIEAASIYLSPTYPKLRDIGERRQALNLSLEALDQPPENNSTVIGFRVAEGAFLIVDEEEIPYTSYLQSGHSGFPEFSGSGIKKPDDIVVFSEFRLCSREVNRLVVVEMEVVEFPDKNFAEIVVSLPPRPEDSKYLTYNKLVLDPQHHRIGFIDYDDPKIEVF